MNDRPAKGAANPLAIQAGFSGLNRQRFPCIQRAVLDEEKSVTMMNVCPAFGDYIDRAAHTSSRLGRNSIVYNLELVNRLRRKLDANCASKFVIVFYAINVKAVAAGAETGKREVTARKHALTRGIALIIGLAQPRREQYEIQVIARDHRRFLNPLGTNRGCDRGLSHVHRRRLFRYGDLLLHCRRSKTNHQRRAAAYVDFDGLVFEAGEPGRFNSQSVAASGDSIQQEVASGTAGSSAHLICRRIRKLNPRCGNRTTGLVNYGALNTPAGP